MSTERQAENSQSAQCKPSMDFKRSVGSLLSLKGTVLEGREKLVGWYMTLSFASAAFVGGTIGAVTFAAIAVAGAAALAFTRKKEADQQAAPVRLEYRSERQDDAFTHISQYTVSNDYQDGLFRMRLTIKNNSASDTQIRSGETGRRAIIAAGQTLNSTLAPTGAIPEELLSKLQSARANFIVTRNGRDHPLACDIQGSINAMAAQMQGAQHPVPGMRP